MQNFGEKLKFYLKKNKINQKQLAKKTGLTESAVSHYCKGIRYPKADILLKITNVLGITIEDMVENEGRNPLSFWIIKSAILNYREGLSEIEKQKLMLYILGEEK